MFPSKPGGSNTVTNSSTMRGWLESTGLDDIIMSTCSCIFGEDEPASPHPGDRREVKSAQPHAKRAGRKAKVMKAGTTVDGTPLLIENTSLGIFGLVPHFGHNHR
jgi:hypothetical protein